MDGMTPVIPVHVYIGIHKGTTCSRVNVWLMLPATDILLEHRLGSWFHDSHLG